MKIVNKESFRSQGRLNEADDMYRVIIDMTKREYALFTQYKSRQKELSGKVPLKSKPTAQTIDAPCFHCQRMNLTCWPCLPFVLEEGCTIKL